MFSQKKSQSQSKSEKTGCVPATYRVEGGVSWVRYVVLIEVLDLFRRGREDGGVVGAVEGVDAVVGQVVGVVDPTGKVHVVRVDDELVHPECGSQ